MAKAKALILRAPGTNCNVEAAFAFEQAGAEATHVHVNQLLRREERLSDYQIMVIPGGFTYGDDIASGKVLANELRLRLGEDIQRFIDKSGLMLGICNGFQIMVRGGILPPFANGVQQVTLTNNDSGRFECRWVHLKVNQKSPCIFTKGIGSMYLPVAHGEGKLVAETSILPKLNAVVAYADEKGDTRAGYPHNPNGSVDNIAGICDDSGRIFALMPHPERHIRTTQHPQWTRQPSKDHGDGFKIFQNAVEWVEAI
ncbi:MAG: phosphoribosylformylglycinamidine synthase I [Chloroflexi bacterium]|nr:phosphoribosylformylglycinamidine synthase I [Chloroflexota bacterium]